MSFPNRFLLPPEARASSVRRAKDSAPATEARPLAHPLLPAITESRHEPDKHA
ncbi:hypothetical protein HMPREF0326_05656 [Desulfovibrio sp. 3_1_syn3]|nr:hypothetical protein HMPREF0326_05656 [Desulfovibrio sp. 3_1_syn3]